MHIESPPDAFLLFLCLWQIVYPCISVVSMLFVGSISSSVMNVSVRQIMSCCSTYSLNSGKIVLLNKP